MIDRDIQTKIDALVGEYLSLESKKGSKLKEISEADVRASFIDRLFDILGWNIHDVDEYNREKYVRDVGFADITLQIDNEPVIFVEAKRFGSIPFVDREKTDWIEEERQVLNYAASPSRKIKWAVLTNFEKFRLFNALNGMLILSFESIYDYKDRLQDLLYISKEMVSSGRINELTEREERPDIDERFLVNLKSWRLSLAKSIFEKNKENIVLQDEDGNIEIEKLKNAVQRILDRLITVRYAEDKLILDSPDQLKHIRDSWYATRSYSCLVKNLMNFFEGFDRIHDSKIFERGHICEQVEIDDEVLGKIIEEMYNINFRKFDFDVLGNTYETYLGHTIHIDNEGNVSLKPAQASRKEQGIYYTPPYVVDYIVKNTVGKVLEGKSPEEVKKIRVLDPACGSGSFLIKAYDYFQEHYAELSKAEKNKVLKSMAKNNGQLPDVEIVDYSEYEKDILRDNIFGVDLDSQAAEIASVNLMLKALRQGEKLPLILGENIQVGNSLISGTEVELQKYFGKDWQEKKPLNWEEAFAEAMGEGGFDVVIGNPPYLQMQKENKCVRQFMREKHSKIYSSQNDLWYYFMMKGIDLLKDGGFLGFITSRYFMEATHAKNIRDYIIKNISIKVIIDFGKVQIFKGVGTHTSIILLEKDISMQEKKPHNKIKVVRVINWNADNEKLLAHIIKHFSDVNYRDNYIEVFPLLQEKLSDESWVLATETTLNILSKLKLNSVELSELCDIGTGVKSGYDKCFVVDEKEVRKYNMEFPLLRKWIKNSDIDSYYVR
ncbi:MAG: N-6 DNA methylase, partial [Thermoplasmata archaeon]|nr:N-6 DNA methylase [Thermoplasmata archaeon]